MFIILNVDYLHSTEEDIPIIDTSVFISLHFPSSISTTSVEITSPLTFVSHSHSLEQEIETIAKTATGNNNFFICFFIKILSTLKVFDFPYNISIEILSHSKVINRSITFIYIYN